MAANHERAGSLVAAALLIAAVLAVGYLQPKTHVSEATIQPSQQQTR